jgi:large subunit ribosomal protein L19
LVLARKHGKEAGATFTVRAVLHEVGVEKVYPIHSPVIAKVDIISSPKKVHKAKLYYLRGFSAKKTRERLK